MADSANEIDGEGASGRKRRSHTRSRTGCTTCRKRHVRCDERTPRCVKCISANRVCEYPTVSVPLRDRRALDRDAMPGEQQPWTLGITQSSKSLSSKPLSTSWKLEPAGGSIDPFDTFPINMPLRSRELLHYFHQVGDAMNVSSANRKDDCIALAVQDPHALRNTLLIAGLHYAWVSGGMHSFESTFLLHKAETIRMINNCIQGSGEMSAACARQIATMCFSEWCCNGSSRNAELHVTGLTAFLDLREQSRDSTIPPDEVEEELLDRYLLLTYTFDHGRRSFIAGVAPAAKDIMTSNHNVLTELMHQWHLEKRPAIERQLNSMRLFPYFFSPQPAGRKVREINVLPIIRNTRVLAEVAEQQEAEPLKPNDSFARGDQAQLMYDWAEIHMRSVAADPEGFPEGSERLMSSASGVGAAIGLFLNSVVSLANLGEPIETRLHRRVLLILKRDIEKKKALVKLQVGMDRDLWFWKVFIGAMSIAVQQKLIGAKDLLGCDKDLETIKSDFENNIRNWSFLTDTTSWEDAKAALIRVSWPAMSGNEPIAKAVWESVTSTR